METRKVSRTYSNAKIVAMSMLAFLCAITILVLFIIFISISRPSFKDFSKYAFVTLCISFGLFLIYGICGLLKDNSIHTYGLKTWAVAIILAATVITLNIIALIKAHDRVLPVITFSIAIGVAFLILLVNTEFCLNDMRRGKFPLIS